MNKVIRVGTRNSKLAIFQAQEVTKKLEALGYKTELVFITTNGDRDRIRPLYQMGIQGIFTRALDTALINHEIDLAIHSLKDVPTLLPNGVIQFAVLKRGNPFDILVFEKLPTDKELYTIGTSSLRRKQQWLNQYPDHKITNMRGNVQTRLEKMAQEPIDATILAAAGIERLGIKLKNTRILNWMIPAPAQGTIGIFGLQDNPWMQKINALNDSETDYCTTIERTFLNILEGGCSMPIGAYAHIIGNNVNFQAVVIDPNDASKKIEINELLSREVLKAEVSKLADKCRSFIFS